MYWNFIDPYHYFFLDPDPYTINPDPHRCKLQQYRKFLWNWVDLVVFYFMGSFSFISLNQRLSICLKPLENYLRNKKLCHFEKATIYSNQKYWARWSGPFVQEILPIFSSSKTTMVLMLDQFLNLWCARKDQSLFFNSI